MRRKKDMKEYTGGRGQQEQSAEAGKHGEKSINGADTLGRLGEVVRGRHLLRNRDMRYSAEGVESYGYGSGGSEKHRFTYSDMPRPLDGEGGRWEGVDRSSGGEDKSTKKRKADGLDRGYSYGYFASEDGRDARAEASRRLYRRSFMTQDGKESDMRYSEEPAESFCYGPASASAPHLGLNNRNLGFLEAHSSHGAPSSHGHGNDPYTKRRGDGLYDPDDHKACRKGYSVEGRAERRSLDGPTGPSEHLESFFQFDPNAKTRDLVMEAITRSLRMIEGLYGYFHEVTSLINRKCGGKDSDSEQSSYKSSNSEHIYSQRKPDDEDGLVYYRDCELEYRRTFNERKQLSFYKNPYHAFLEANNNLVAVKNLAKITKKPDDDENGGSKSKAM